MEKRYNAANPNLAFDSLIAQLAAPNVIFRRDESALQLFDSSQPSQQELVATSMRTRRTEFDSHMNEIDSALVENTNVDVDDRSAFMAHVRVLSELHGKTDMQIPLIRDMQHRFVPTGIILIIQSAIGAIGA
jgi:hypothetical protein